MIGVAIAALSVWIGTLPFAPWFAGGPPGRQATAVGVQAASELWIIPPLALVVFVCGVAIAFRSPARVAAYTATAASALSLSWALVATIRRPGVVVATGLGNEGSVSLPREMAPLTALPSAYWAIAACATAGLIALVHAVRVA